MHKFLWRAAAVALAPVAIGVVGASIPATAACVPGARLCVEISDDTSPARLRAIVDRAVDTAGEAAPGSGGDVCQPTLGGVVVPPLPAPTPGVRPVQVCRAAVGTVGGLADPVVDRAIATIGGLGGGDVCQPTLGGVVVPPLPAPTPGVRPQALVDDAAATCDAVLGGGVAPSADVPIR